MRLVGGDLHGAAGLLLRKPQVAAGLRRDLRGVEHLDHLHLKLLVLEEIQRLLEALGIEQIREQKDEPAPAGALGKGAQSGREPRRPGERRRPAQKLEHLMKLPLAPRHAHGAVQLRAEPEQIHALQAGEPDVGERRRDVAGLRELRAAPAARGAPLHRGAGIDEEVQMQVLLLLEELDEEAVEPAVDVPVHRAEIVAEDVVAVIGKLQR